MPNFRHTRINKHKENNMRTEYHIHSEFSDDSNELMENQIETAIAKGIDEMCFTDHVDYGIKRDWDDPRGIEYRQGDGISSGTADLEPMSNVNYPEYFKKLDAMREKYAGQITIKNGLEFGVQSITVDDYNRLYAKYKDKLDFVLFSMHQVNNNEFWNQEFQKGKTQAEYNREYYNEILKTMRLYQDYCCLSHLDLIVRYDKNGVYPFEEVKDVITEILKQAIADGKGIEINNSAWHYQLGDTQPSKNILKLYKELGGRIITVGSDAHTTKYVADHYDDAISILKEIGFEEICTFDHMQPIFHKI